MRKVQKADARSRELLGDGGFGLEPAPAWRRVYPALLGCLMDGRVPSKAEIDSVMRRMVREIGAWAGQVKIRPGPGDRREAVLREVARVALVGRDCAGPKRENPLARERQSHDPRTQASLADGMP